MNPLDRELRDHVDAQVPPDVPPFGAVLARRDRRTRVRRTTAAAGLVLVVAAVAGVVALDRPSDPPSYVVDPTPTPTDPTPTADPTAAYQPAPPVGGKPPEVELLLADGTIDLPASSACYGNGCFDGLPPEDPPSAGSPEVVEFGFFHGDWDFTATFSDTSAPCPRRITVPVAKSGPHTWRLPPAGNAGPQEVSLFGRGPDGDLSTTFAWTTPVAGTMPTPAAYAGLYSNAGGERHAYPLELSVSDLATTPETATAELTVTASDGTSTVVAARRQGGRCWAAGSVYFTGSQADSDRVLALGPPPYTYDVRLTLDGQRYDGRGVWPRDERKDEQPFVDLFFDPPLPAYTG